MPPEGPTQAAEKQIFGWPSDEAGGRVWVLLISMSSWRRGDDDNFWSTEAGFEAMLDLLKDCDGESRKMDLLAIGLGSRRIWMGFVMFEGGWGDIL